MPTFYEFFAGGGMVRAGLGPGWRCLLANDIDPKKAAVYRDNWGEAGLRVGDIRDLTPDDAPCAADLAWASFPCQDLSLAGGGAGLQGARSSAFWPFIDLMKTLGDQGRPPTVIALENVVGALTSHGGKDFTAICAALAGLGYRFGALAIDAALFVPQSRPRLFVIAVRQDLAPPAAMDGPRDPWHTTAVRRAYERLPQGLRAAWLWLHAPPPPPRRQDLKAVIDLESPWRPEEETARLLGMMNAVNRAKAAAAKAAGGMQVGALYRRMRSEGGRKVQRAEVRFDGLAGCLRTPAGGSSRQSILVVEGAQIRSRLLSPRETARLMGLPETYRLPKSATEGYHLTGDGVAVPVAGWIARHILEPTIAEQRIAAE